jgi:hypothetical protein
LSSILDVTSLEMTMASSLWHQGKTLRAHEQMFGEKPRKFRSSSPLPKVDHPEMDASDFLDAHGTTQYQSVIGTMQWFISLGLFDVHTPVMTLSSYLMAPRKGHMDRAKMVCSYLA